MAYTEIKERNGNRYFYRVRSIREGEKFRKERLYLGKNLSKEKLLEKEEMADKEFLEEKINRGIKEIKSKIVKILRKNKVKKAGIFGSYSRGEQKKNSDVDILIEPPKGLGFKFFKISIDLEKEIGKKFDVLTYSGINPLLKKKILRDEVRII